VREEWLVARDGVFSDILYGVARGSRLLYAFQISYSISPEVFKFTKKE